jgi:hypothetical protein
LPYQFDAALLESKIPTVRKAVRIAFGTTSAQILLPFPAKFLISAKTALKKNAAAASKSATNHIGSNCSRLKLSYWFIPPCGDRNHVLQLVSHFLATF